MAFSLPPQWRIYVMCSNQTYFLSKPIEEIKQASAYTIPRTQPGCTRWHSCHAFSSVYLSHAQSSPLHAVRDAVVRSGVAARHGRRGRGVCVGGVLQHVVGERSARVGGYDDRRVPNNNVLILGTSTSSATREAYSSSEVDSKTTDPSETHGQISDMQSLSTAWELGSNRSTRTALARVPGIDLPGGLHATKSNPVSPRPQHRSWIVMVLSISTTSPSSSSSSPSPSPPSSRRFCRFCYCCLLFCSTLLAAPIRRFPTRK